MAEVLSDAGRSGRPVAVVALTDLPADGPAVPSADYWASRLPALRPEPWEPPPDLRPGRPRWRAGFETYWLSDGLARDGREALLAGAGGARAGQRLRKPAPGAGPAPGGVRGRAIRLTGCGPRGREAAEVPVTAIGPDPVGDRARTGPRDAALRRRRDRGRGGAGRCRPSCATASPASRSPARGAGAVSLTDDALQRRKVALLAGATTRGAGAALAALLPAAGAGPGGRPDRRQPRRSAAGRARCDRAGRCGADPRMTDTEAADRLGGRAAGCCCALPGRGWRPAIWRAAVEDPLMPVRCAPAGAPSAAR
jgi:hypothetical protein